MEKMSALDASFLDVEDAVSHMHIGSIGIFEGPPPPHEELRSMVLAKLPLVPRYRQVVRAVPFSIGRPALGRRPALQPRLPPAPHGPSRPGGRGRAPPPRGARHVPAARPLQAALGDVGRRGPRGRALGAHLEDPPLHGRRRCRHRPALRPDGPRAGHSPAVPRRNGRPGPPGTTALLVAGGIAENLLIPLQAARALSSPEEVLRRGGKRCAGCCG